MDDRKGLGGVVLAALVCSLFCLSAVAGAPAKGGDEARLAAGNNRFALDLYKEFRGEPGNLFLSPFSIRTALAMTWVGADKDTAAQMKKVLHLDMAKMAAHRAFAATMAGLASGGKGQPTLSIANALFGMQGYRFLKPFTKVNRKFYGGGMQSVDFRKAEKARKTINDWVAKKTNQKIEDLIPTGILDALTRLVLVNAVYFKGDWLSRFDAKRTKAAPFLLADGAKQQVQFMYQQGEYSYAQDKDVQVLEMPYQGDRISMLVLLPAKSAGLNALEESLTDKRIAAWRQRLREQKVKVFLPKFKMTWGTKKINDALIKLGMPDAFDKAKANFSGINGAKQPSAESLYIAAVFHKAFVEINEEGTEAAAATAVVMKARGMGRPPKVPVFKADHPFLFLIQDKATGTILFMGRLAKPQA